MGLHTPLYDTHLAAGARMVDFAGWAMPVNYGSQLDEHHAVRRDAGMFDISHMGVLDLLGTRVRDFLRHVLANDVAKLNTPGKALYSCMLNEQGGVIDDLIVYFLNDSFFRLVVNASTRGKDIAWLKQHANAFQVTVTERSDLAMIAVQGPNARDKVAAALGAVAQAVPNLDMFTAVESGHYFFARTGYTGEDGVEIMLPATEAAVAWLLLHTTDIAQCGLGARDTLRLEAGLHLYGNDMDESVTPLESGLGWTVAFQPEDRHFMGRAALQAQLQGGVTRKLVGLVLQGSGVLRARQIVSIAGHAVGEVTSGTFSPTLQRSIALARVPIAAQGDVQVEVRGKSLTARIVRYPFVRNGTALI